MCKERVKTRAASGREGDPGVFAQMSEYMTESCSREIGVSKAGVIR